MRIWMFAVAVTAILLSGCKQDAAGSPPSQGVPPDPAAAKFVGTWKIDLPSIKFSSMSNKDAAKTVEELKKTRANDAITFNADGTFSEQDGADKETGSFAVTGDKATTTPSGADPLKQEWKISPDGKRISTSIMGGEAIESYDMVKG